MIKALKYSVTFPTTGRTLARNVTFDSGLTAITGPNEAGKSYVIEMIRFGLFGSAALRGSADDYKTLKLEMEFVCRSKTYRVERKSNNAKVFEGTTALAVGTKPVNAKILAILGFGLDVFDVACVTNQGEVERLGNMKPAERKRMVDQVIGVDRLDEIAKWCGEQATFLNREVEILEKGLVEPVAPEEPEGYRPFAELSVEFEQKKLLWDERNVLQGWLSQQRREPVAPQDPGGLPIPELEAQQEVHRAWLVEQRRMQSLPIVDYDAEALRASWAAWDLWEARVAFEKAHPRPTMSQLAIVAELLNHDRFEEHERLRKQRDTILGGQSTTCPSCKTTFLLAAEALEHAEAALAAVPKFGIPLGSRAELREQQVRVDKWAQPATLVRWEELKDVPEAKPPAMPRAKINVPAGAVTTEQRRAMLTPEPPNPDGALKSRRVYEADLAVYEREAAAYHLWHAEALVKQARLMELDGIAAEMAALHRLCSDAKTFERDLQEFMAESDEYATRKAMLDEKRVEALGWKNAKAMVAELRTRIKTYLVPSLSRVASHLLAQMTGGQRSSIIVDEEFEVMVDGQALGTLSGSGKACANLALRIGLGQVLTNNVLSLFIGDEIDASMDDERADFTQGSLQSLAQRISQILLITHKVPTADHVVTFEGGDGQRDNSLRAAE